MSALDFNSLHNALTIDDDFDIFFKQGEKKFSHQSIICTRCPTGGVLHQASIMSVTVCMNKELK
jgi:hypothetical protein